MPKWLLVFGLLCHLFCSINAYTIDASCNNVNTNNRIQAAVTEAVNMANYGIWRVQENDPRIDGAMKQLLGTNARAWFNGKTIL